MKSGFVVGVFGSLIALAVFAQEPRGWKQPMLQPTIPPKVVGRGSTPVWKMPLVHPTLPPTLAGKAVVKQQHMLLVPQQTTNGLSMTLTNFTLIIPGQGIGDGIGPSSDEKHLTHWQPELMYPTYPPKLAPLQSLGLLELS